MLDLAIRRGNLVDGTGGPRRRADVGILDGRVVAIGEVGDARIEIDARQDRCAGLCRCSLALRRPGVLGRRGSRPPAFTASPPRSLGTAGSPWRHSLMTRWTTSFACCRSWRECRWNPSSYLFPPIGRRLGSSSTSSKAPLGSMPVSSSGIRQCAVLPWARPRRSVRRHTKSAPTMVQLLRDGLEAGGLGFSSSRGPAHFDGNGDPIPSMFAAAEEFEELAAVCGEFEGTSLEFAPPRVDRFSSDDLHLLASMSAAAQRPLNWNLLRIGEGSSELVDRMLAAGEYARAHGGKIVALNMPIPSRARFSFSTGFVLDALPGWGPIFSLPTEQRIKALCDPAVRRELETGVQRTEGPLIEMADFGNRVIAETFTPEAAHYQGRLVSEIAQAERKTPLDALLDIVCSDELATTFCRPPSEPSRGDWMAMADVVARRGHGDRRFRRGSAPRLHCLLRLPGIRTREGSPRTQRPGARGGGAIHDRRTGTALRAP